MSRTQSGRKRGIAALLLLALASLAVLAGCGSSSSTTAASATSQGQAAGQNADRRARLAACLKQQGVTLPQRPPGGQAPGGGGGGGAGRLFGGGPGNGRFSDPKVRAALQKCGFAGGQRRNSAAYKQRLTKFTACVRSNGYNLPTPNTSGKGPVFDPTKVNRTDPKFLTAVAKCQSLLQFRRGFGGGGGPGGGAPAGAGA